LKLGSALILSQNPIFEIASNKKGASRAYRVLIVPAFSKGLNYSTHVWMSMKKPKASA